MFDRSFLRHKRFLLSLCICCLVVVCGVFKLFVQLQKYKSLERDYKKNLGALKMYFNNIKSAPNDKIIALFSHQKETLVNKKKSVLGGHFSKKSLENVFPEVRTVLQFRKILKDKRQEFALKDIGFQDYKIDLPTEDKLLILRKELYFVEKLLKIFLQNDIKNVKKVIRVKNKHFDEKGLEGFVEHTAFFSFSCQSKQLFSLLYDIMASDDILISKAIRIESFKESLWVLLKCSLLEILPV